MGYAPTRRDVFSRQEAGKFREAILAKIRDLGVDLSRSWILTGSMRGPTVFRLRRGKVAKAFRDQGVVRFQPSLQLWDEALSPNWATPWASRSYWGPRDDAPLPDGARSRDTQCGLFATSKILARYDVPFTYIVNSCIDTGVRKRLPHFSAGLVGG